MPLPPPFGFHFDCDSKVPLHYFNVTTDGSWTLDELNDIRKGTARVGSAFTKHLGSAVNKLPASAFREVFFDDFTWPVGYSTIHFSTGDPDNFTGIECRVTNTHVACHPSVTLSVYTVVHELGHVFSNRTGGQVQGTNTLFGRMNNPDDNHFCPNAQVGTVFDARIIDGSCSKSPIFGKWVDFTNTGDWQRNAKVGVRGWGSPKCALPNPSDFQQNPYEVRDLDPATTEAQRIAEVEEAGADMFLNWAHSTLARDGFLDVDWGPTCSGSPVPDSGLPGFGRFEWTRQTMVALFFHHNWN